MMEERLTYRIAFASLRGMNRMLAEQILARVGSEEQFFEMSERQLSAVMSTRNRLFDADYRLSAIERARREVEFVESSSIRALYFTDDDYPARLSVADDAPLMLFACGGCDFNRGRFLSIVGTRRATPYGLDFVSHLVEDLSRKMAEPITIVSGLAFGIDAAAHAAALRNGLPTVGVLAHGLQMIYPAQHRDMAAQMVKSCGGLLTEFGCGDAVHKGNFVARNRIVAAMSDCTVVAESAQKGGALLTARLAYDYGRDVVALPGRSSDKYSAGCNALIANNMAALVESADDVMKVMGWAEVADKPTQPSLFEELTDEETMVVDLLRRKDDATVNQLSIALNLNIGRTMSLLIDMEFKGLILSYPGGKYRLA